MGPQLLAHPNPTAALGPAPTTPKEGVSGALSREAGEVFMGWESRPRCGMAIDGQFTQGVLDPGCVFKSPRTVRTAHPRLHPDKETRASGAFCAVLQRRPVQNQCGDPCSPAALYSWLWTRSPGSPWGSGSPSPEPPVETWILTPGWFACPLKSQKFSFG